MEEIRSLDIRDEYGGDADLCEHEVVGESFYKKEIQKRFEESPDKYGRDNSCVDIDVILIPEKGNKFDENSVRVDALLGIKDGRAISVPIGHLPREEAKSFRQTFPSQVLIARGEIDGHYWLDHPDGDFHVTVSVPEEYDW